MGEARRRQGGPNFSSVVCQQEVDGQPKRGDKAMVGWLKRTFGGEKPKTIDEVMSAYGALLEKYPLAIMDIAMLPMPKTQMKAMLKALYARAKTAADQNTLEVGFQFLSKFQDGVGATPIDAVTFDGKPALARHHDADLGRGLDADDIAKLDKWLAWDKLSLAETEILMAEWKRFKAGEPI
jgi:hypothetical protein